MTVQPASNAPLDFRHLIGGFASGVTVVTTVAKDGTLHGFTATAFSSVSLAPPLVLVCLDMSADCHPMFELTDHFAVSILATTQRDVAMRFAAKGTDKFAELRITKGARTGAPLIEDAFVHLECNVHARYAAGDHTVLIGEVVAGHRAEGEPLLYHARAFGRFEALPTSSTP